MAAKRPSQPSFSGVVCAYNEERHLAAVLEGLLSTPFIQQIIVVDDGSTDHTARILRRYARFKRITPIFLPSNQGKGFAMAEAIAAASGDILVFVDADLINWNGDYVTQLVSPLLEGRADLVIGVPAGPNDSWETVDVGGVQRWLSGERCLWRTDILPMVEKIRPSRFGVETLINMHYRTRHQPILILTLRGLIHVIKFEKTTRREAWREYINEVRQILLVLVRHPLLTIMTYVPDFIEMRNALRSLARRMLKVET